MPSTAKPPKKSIKQFEFKDLFNKTVKSETPMFSDSSLHTEDGGKFATKCDEAINKIFINAIQDGFRVRDIAQVLYQAVSLIEAKKSIEFSDDYLMNDRMIKEEARRKKRLAAIEAADLENSGRGSMS